VGRGHDGLWRAQRLGGGGAGEPAPSERGRGAAGRGRARSSRPGDRRAPVFAYMPPPCEPSPPTARLDIDELLRRWYVFTLRELFDPAGNPRHAARRAISDLYFYRGWKIEQEMFIKGAAGRLYFDASCAPASVDADQLGAVNAALSAEASASSGIKNFFTGRDTTGSVRREGDCVRLSYVGPSRYFAHQLIPAVLGAVTFQPPAKLLATRQAQGRRELARVTNPSLWEIAGRPSWRDLEPPDELRSTVTGLKLILTALRLLNHFR